MRKTAENFSRLFKGSERAHGFFEVKQDRSNGKKQGKAITVKTSGPTLSHMSFLKMAGCNYMKATSQTL